jgi:hypothetical protein
LVEVLPPPAALIVAICSYEHFPHIRMRENRVRRTGGFLAASGSFRIALDAICSGSILFKLQHLLQKAVKGGDINFAIHSQGRSLHHQRNQLFAAVVGEEIGIQLERGMDDVAASLHGVYFLSCPFDIIIITDNAAFVNRFLKFF